MDQNKFNKELAHIFEIPQNLNKNLFQTFLYETAKSVIRASTCFFTYNSKKHGIMLSKNNDLLPTYMKNPNFWKIRNNADITLAQQYPIHAIMVCNTACAIKYKQHKTENSPIVLDLLANKYNITFAEPKSEEINNYCYPKDKNKKHIYLISEIPTAIQQDILNNYIKKQKIVPL